MDRTEHELPTPSAAYRDVHDVLARGESPSDEQLSAVLEHDPVAWFIWTESAAVAERENHQQELNRLSQHEYALQHAYSTPTSD
jgi:hypothetical protein